MNSIGDQVAVPPLRWSRVPVLILIADLDYGIAFSTRLGAPTVLLALPCIFMLSRLRTARCAFYAGLICGMAIYVPQLWFFLGIFRGAAIPICSGIQ